MFIVKKNEHISGVETENQKLTSGKVLESLELISQTLDIFCNGDGNKHLCMGHFAFLFEIDIKTETRLTESE